MQQYARIEIRSIEETPSKTAPLRQAAHDIGLSTVEAIQSVRLFFLRHPQLTGKQVNTLCQRLLSDPVIETYHWEWVADTLSQTSEATIIEVETLPGVTDRAAYEVKQAAARLGLPPIQVATGSQYKINGSLSQAELQRLAQQVLCNEVVQQYRLGSISPAFIEEVAADDSVEMIELAELNDAELLELSQARRLALNLGEMQVLRDFGRRQGRPLTDAELEMAAQTWSEHCYHKTFRAKIHYTETDHGNQKPVHAETIDGLLRATIRKATDACHKSWLISTFVDNAGIIAFDDEYVLSFKVETHNHPSALEPFGGANTGVGGVIRDIVGVSARPIAITNVLCFGPQNLPAKEVPAGTLHPRRVQNGVVAGVGDYGNKMGIPTVNGAVLYHPGYTANPLVYCGCVGLAPVNSHVTTPQVGDRLIVLGGRTGRDGLRGATFSSLDLDSETSEASFASTAVQIGDPIVEKDVTEVIMLARDAALYNAVTDCGAGGLSSAVGEMAGELGAIVELNQVGLKYSGLRPWEIWLSEAQERMVLAVPSQNLSRLADLCTRYNVDWDDIGHFSGDAQMTVTYNARTVVDLPMALLHEGHPQLELTAEWQHVTSQAGLDETALKYIDPAKALLRLLADPNIASKEAIIRTYDHEVQGGTVVKPLTGIRNHGPSDAAVIKPLGTKTLKGVAISNGINPAFGLIDPYAMALSVVDEAIRNAVAVGGDPDQLALLDNFCWGNPNLPDRLGGLVRAAKGCHDAARAFDAPFISGKDSLNNEYVGADGQRTPIPGTLLVSAIAIVPDISQAVTMDLKAAENLLYLVGTTRNELGGSVLAHYYKLAATTVPGLPQNALHVARRLHGAMRQQLVSACHDVSEGGIAVAAAEMALAGGLGLTLDVDTLTADLSLVVALFSESNGRWLVEVTPENSLDFETSLSGCPLIRCGQVTTAPLLQAGPIVLDIATLERVWRGNG